MVARVGVVTALMVTFGIVATAAAQQKTQHFDLDAGTFAKCITLKSQQLGQTPVLARDVDFNIDESSGAVHLIGSPEQRVERRARFVAAMELCTPQKTAEAK
jgi:hypothetical protein